jgi:hypothetical protein
VQYGSISAPSSRAKWARAIVASVEAERAESQVLKALTALALEPEPPTDNTLALHEAAKAWVHVRAALGLPPPRAGYAAAPVPPQAGSSALPDNLFYAAVRPVAAAMISLHGARFAASTHVAAYLSLVERVATAAMPHASPTSRVAMLPLSPPSMPDASSMQSSSSSSPFAQCAPQPPQRSAPWGSHRELFDDIRTREVSLSAFARLGVIGQGSYGSVYVWRHKLTGQLYSVKVCEKAVLKSKASVHTAIRELACSVTVRVCMRGPG